MTNRPAGNLTTNGARALSAMAVGLAAIFVLGSCGAPEGEGSASEETRSAGEQQQSDQAARDKDAPDKGTEQDSTANNKSAHFESIRQADPCELGETKFLEQFGSKQMTVPGSKITECRLLSRDPGDDDDVYTFTLDLHTDWSTSDAEDAAAKDNIAGHQAFQEEYSTDDASHRSCHYKLPYEGQPSALYLSAVRTPPYGQEDEKWSEACDVAKEYLTEIAEHAMSLPAAQQSTSDGLTGKNPCAREDDLVAALSGYELDDTTSIGPYACQLTLSNKKKNQELTVDVSFAFHERQKPSTSNEAGISAKKISMTGLYGVRHQNDANVSKSCNNAIEVREAQNMADDDAHYLNVGVTSSKLELKNEDDKMEAPDVSCDLTDTLTEIALDDVRP